MSINTFRLNVNIETVLHLHIVWNAQHKIWISGVNPRPSNQTFTPSTGPRTTVWVALIDTDLYDLLHILADYERQSMPLPTCNIKTKICANLILHMSVKEQPSSNTNGSDAHNKHQSQDHDHSVSATSCCTNHNQTCWQLVNLLFSICEWLKINIYTWHLEHKPSTLYQLWSAITYLANLFQ